jgi:hypothetical protein
VIYKKMCECTGADDNIMKYVGGSQHLDGCLNRTTRVPMYCYEPQKGETQQCIGTAVNM